jgi:hypothetical protein
MKPSFAAMLALRVIFFGLTLYFMAGGQWDYVLMYGIIFIVTLPLLWLAKSDDRYYLLDASILAIFAMAAAVNAFPWPSYNTPYSYDKFYHVAGGAWVAAFAAAWFHKRIPDRTALFISIVSVAIAIGAFWEVFEWALSLLPPPVYQVSGDLAEGMMDIIADTLGALIVTGILFIRRHL